MEVLYNSGQIYKARQATVYTQWKHTAYEMLPPGYLRNCPEG